MFINYLLQKKKKMEKIKYREILSWLSKVQREKKQNFIFIFLLHFIIPPLSHKNGYIDV